MLDKNKVGEDMGEFFGTDGIRGVANAQLTPELAFRLGVAAGVVLSQQTRDEHVTNKVLIGKDSRLSSDMLENALAAGFMSVGVDVVKLGLIPTPGVSYLTTHYTAMAGAMISASHNPYYDNGIKIFNGQGEKLPEAVEEQIEQYLSDEQMYRQLPRPTHEGVGRCYDDTEGLQIYSEHLVSTIRSRSFANYRIVLDCANGSASALAPDIFRSLGAQVVSLSDKPNGTNINVECGSTHIEALREQVLLTEADLGLAFDGDADRLIAVDHLGNIIDGDFVLAVCGQDLQERGQLKDNTIVTTVMANIGFFAGVERLAIQTVKTKVGDKYVLEEMLEHGYVLGGEQSGHIIFLEYGKTGDGILTGLQLTDLLVRKQKTLAQACEIMRKFPQLLVNVAVNNKEALTDNQVIQLAIRENEQKLGELGRVLVRPSGTEPLVRVMAEGPDEAQLEEIVNQLVDIVKRELA